MTPIENGKNGQKLTHEKKGKNVYTISISTEGKFVNKVDVFVIDKEKLFKINEAKEKIKETNGNNQP